MLLVGPLLLLWDLITISNGILDQRSCNPHWHPNTKLWQLLCSFHTSSFFSNLDKSYIAIYCQCIRILLLILPISSSLTRIKAPKPLLNFWVEGWNVFRIETIWAWRLLQKWCTSVKNVMCRNWSRSWGGIIHAKVCRGWIEWERESTMTTAMQHLVSFGDKIHLQVWAEELELLACHKLLQPKNEDNECNLSKNQQICTHQQ